MCHLIVLDDARFGVAGAAGMVAAQNRNSIGGSLADARMSNEKEILEGQCRQRMLIRTPFVL